MRPLLLLVLALAACGPSGPYPVTDADGWTWESRESAHKRVERGSWIKVSDSDTHGDLIDLTFFVPDPPSAEAKK